MTEQDSAGSRADVVIDAKRSPAVDARSSLSDQGCEWIKTGADGIGIEGGQKQDRLMAGEDSRSVW